MALIIRRPLSDEQKKILEAKSRPSAEDILNAQDDLFMNILTRLNELEMKSPTLKTKVRNSKIV